MKVVAHRRARLGDGPWGQLEDRPRPWHRPHDAPRAHRFRQGEDASFPVEEDHVEGGAHPEGVDGVAGLEPQPLPPLQRRAKEQPPRPGEEAICHPDSIAEVESTGLVADRAPRHRRIVP